MNGGVRCGTTVRKEEHGAGPAAHRRLAAGRGYRVGLSTPAVPRHAHNHRASKRASLSLQQIAPRCPRPRCRADARGGHEPHLRWIKLRDGT
jgi:hypothetical protein